MVQHRAILTRADQ